MPKQLKVMLCFIPVANKSFTLKALGYPKICMLSFKHINIQKICKESKWYNNGLTPQNAYATVSMCLDFLS